MLLQFCSFYEVYIEEGLHCNTEARILYICPYVYY